MAGGDADADDDEERAVAALAFDTFFPEVVAGDLSVAF